MRLKAPKEKKDSFRAAPTLGFNYCKNCKIYHTRYKKPRFHHQICFPFNQKASYRDLIGYVDALGRQAGKVKVDGKWQYFYKEGLVWYQMYTK